MKFLALLVTLGFAPLLPAAVISSAERLDPTGANSTFLLTASPNNFRPHTPIYYNTSFTYRNVPSYLQGADSLRTLFADSQDTDYQLRIRLEVAATVFLVIDDRIEDVPGTMPLAGDAGVHRYGGFSRLYFLHVLCADALDLSRKFSGR